MFKQILKQLWFYRRGNAWLFVEMTLITAASWFLVNTVWPYHYRSKLPDGYNAEGVYAVVLNTLYDGQRGYDAASDTPEARSADFRRIGEALNRIPEIQEAAPVGYTLPGLSAANYNTSAVVSIDTVEGTQHSVYFAYHAREAGSRDMEIMGYKVIWPADGRIEDVPGSAVITYGLAEELYPGENPVGRKLTEADPRYNWTISGVIAPVKIYKDREYRDFVMYASADITRDPSNVVPYYCFRLKPGVDEKAFIAEASRTWGERLAFGNYRMGSIASVEDRLESESADNFTWQALLIFLLVCMLIGVASFAWLRIRERRSETGVRRAMGASSAAVLLSYLAEVWMLYLGALALGIVLVLNVVLIGKVDFCSPGLDAGIVSGITRSSLPLLFDPVLHFLCVSGIVAAILLAVVTVSTVIPVAGALKEPMAEVLKDE